MIWLRRALSLATTLLVVAWPTAAGADPAGPTDYRSVIEAIQPQTDAMTVSIVGGDSFVVLEQQQAVPIEVRGYNGEPYLRWSAEGIVEQNRRSPATYLNTDRFGTAESAELPADADAAAAPEWDVVADDGVYAWHDHRAHWMLAQPPLGLGPGDQIVDDVIPVIVEGEVIELEVASYWQDPPSLLPALSGAALGFGAVLAVRKREAALWVLLGVGAVAGATVGMAQFLSLPSATEPSPILWALPVVALVAAGAGALVRQAPATHLPLVFGGAVALVVLATLRFDAMTKAILPTDLPFWVDRFATAFSLVSGVGAVVLSAIALGRILSPAAPVVSAGASAEA